MQHVRITAARLYAETLGPSPAKHHLSGSLMRRALVAQTILFLLLGAPSLAEACTCVLWTGPAGQPAPPKREWHERSRIFIGHALEVDELPQQDPKQIVRFVVEASWRGAMPDTVTLRVGAHASCASYIAGFRYFVFADIDSASGALVTERCDHAWGIDYPASIRMQNQLGPPGWIAPPVGRRSIDRAAIRLGEPLLRVGADMLMILPPRGDDVARFEIGDYVSDTARWKPQALRLSPGLYQFRITWTDGSSYESYISMRCHRSAPGHSCPPAPNLSMLRVRR